MVANGQRKRAGAAGSWMGLSVSLRENARPSFWERPSQESCLQPLVGTLRFSGCSKSYPRTDVAASLHCLLSPQGVQLHPKWPPSHLHPRSPGSGRRARNSIGTTSSHLESWGKSIP